MADEGREARNRYAREWRSRNKEKVKEANHRYWEKKAKAGTEKAELVRNIRNDSMMCCPICNSGFLPDAFIHMECNRLSDEREFAISLLDVIKYCPICGMKFDVKED